MTTPINKPTPVVKWAFDLLATNNGHPCVKVSATFAIDDVPEDRYIPRMELTFPATLHGKSIDELQREAIEKAQACFHEAGLLALIQKP